MVARREDVEIRPAGNSMPIEGERRLAPVHEQEADGEGEGYGEAGEQDQSRSQGPLVQPWVLANCQVVQS